MLRENLKKVPFNLEDNDIAWVEKTLKEMTLEEKIGQLFCPIGISSDERVLKNSILTKHVGGIMYRPGSSEDMQKTHLFLQNNSKVPLLISANLEAGGDGIATDGTSFGKQMQVAATADPEQAYRLGKIACSEGGATGCNWAFAPVVDIDFNFRNPITNVRTYGDDPDRVLQMAKEYLRAAKEENVAVSIKHFPGDGVDERDQHLVTSVNTQSKDEWDATFGKVYKGLIDEGALTVMAGHISLPAYQERDGYLPATLSVELLQGLLREKLGFNGMVVTDATPMVGFTSAMSRKKAVPAAIARGCDMFLFNKDLEEDVSYMIKGYHEGILTDDRLNEAVTRILATKASLMLHKKKKEKTLVPRTSELEKIGCKKHEEWAYECADQAITLVKDTQNLLPINPNVHKKVLLQILGDFPSNDRVFIKFNEVLTQQGFEVIEYEREDFGAPLDTVEEFKAKYDLVIYIGNIENASNKTVSRLNWYTFFGMGNNIPWFVEEVPTLFVSLANPYHLLDAPMIKTYINGYSNNNFVIEKVVEKLLGHSEFKGENPVDPFCGRISTTY
ncbi:glycoside hydrolase family 3 protein [Salipaludibacillus sp. LMS25]|uniref:glycoside hydrolase family 3 N-terminal domain-containing protein n=1 Tax=Salipaludibacillus sp. LMS25 TaxID=2924031 RepID=UPI0020D0CED3|nr:glycoside hydrolase family 3 N-terminal domain-containing protein [Salipaludibacillus sp. LMS25]UTR15933.1 glycoside hydrolase family 3 protein [Salipaludibacillus sp. LMS25]